MKMTLKPFAATIVLAALLGLGCRTQPAGESLDVVLNEPMPVTERWAGQHATVTTRSLHVVRTPEQWESVWDLSGAGGPPPAVDFSRDHVIAIFMGQRSTGGHAIEIVQAVHTGREVRVLIRAHAPAPGEIVTQALTSPWEMIVVPAFDAPARFIEAGRTP